MEGYIAEELELAGKKLIIETGKMAKQADGAVVVTYGDTTVLSTVVAAKSAKEGQDFFPLTVEYREKFYAAGKIPGGFFKREGKMREKEVLTCRLIDRPIRPLFPEGYLNEVQIISTVISADTQNDPDILSIIGSAAALSISDIPFDGPVGAVRVGRVDGKIVINPTADELDTSDLNVVIAGTEQAVTMIEGEAKEVTEEEMLEVILAGHAEIKKIAQFVKALAAKCGKTKREVELVTIDSAIKAKVDAEAHAKINTAVKITDKLKRQEEIETIKTAAREKLEKELGEEVFAEKKRDINMSLEEIEMNAVRLMIAKDHIRPDGRKFDEIRAISCEVGLVRRTHGSALFTRGQTQALVITTLGSEDDAQILDDLEGEAKKHYTLQYNFPPFSVGEVKRVGGPGRREIGHGALAERALKAVIPDRESFPYTVQVVSEILESNGSSSMASVCGATLALMDAGVPIKKPVAGIAMGLIEHENQHVILTDIQGAEDHFGDMDFKVAGTRDGITAIQMDIKIKGVTPELMSDALAQAKKARLFILEEKIVKCLPEPRKEMSPHAPKMSLIKINKERIKDLIGPGGKNIKGIVEETGAKIDVEQDGTVRVFAANGEIMQRCEEMIKALTGSPDVGGIYTGEVTGIKEFGAFVEIMPGIDGLLHISQISDERVKRVEDVLHMGDVVTVKVLKVDESTGKISLTRKDVPQKPQA
ncbi:MAG: polyribonucleotide nucleotidyltransferase [Spirochaetia bacterium]|nr:polyribonucleotide nucleotidyltransferase [Spirochaetia bacterium]